jgi:hypothetical protein
VEEAIGVELGVDALAAGVFDLVTAGFRGTAANTSLAAAVKALFEPLRVCLEKVKRKVDVARGFEALDSACAGSNRGSALEVFAVRWGICRGTAQPPDVDPFAAAIVAQDLTRLKELIGGHDAEEIEVDVERLPLDFPRWPRKTASLLEIASAVGGQVLQYLLEFRQL